MNQKNIILLTIDCLRADHLSCMGYSKKTTPFIDSLAKEGILFTNAISVGAITKQSFPAILGSIYPLMCENLDNSMKKTTPIAKMLQKNGYATGAFHSNIIISKRYNYQKGFDVFDDNFPTAQKVFNKTMWIRRQKRLQPLLTYLSKTVLSFIREKSPKVTAEKINDAALKWINSINKPFFAWIHYMDVHGPYLPEQKYVDQICDTKISRKELFILWRKIVDALKNPLNLSESEIKIAVDYYDACILQVDDYIKKLVQSLKESGKLKNTIIIITADHGEEFNDHGNLSHHRKLYDELIHVPFIMYNWDANTAGLVIDEVISSIDIAPTILDIVNIPSSKKYFGKSVLPIINNNEKRHIAISETDCVFKNGQLFAENTKQISIRTKNWKLIYVENPERYELYDLKNNTKEKKNVYESRKDIACKLKKEIDKHIKKIKEYAEKEEVFISSVINQIKI